MESRIKLFGHPAHMTLIAFPLGLLSTAVAFDAAYLLTKSKGWAEASYRMIGAGLISGVVAAGFGLVDWLAIPPRTRAKEVGLLHGVGNAVLLGLFLLSYVEREEKPSKPSGLAISLAMTGGVLGGLTGWLGGELTSRLGVGIDNIANLNAPPSLSDLPIPDADEVVEVHNPEIRV